MWMLTPMHQLCGIYRICVHVPPFTQRFLQWAVVYGPFKKNERLESCLYSLERPLTFVHIAGTPAFYSTALLMGVRVSRGISCHRWLRAEPPTRLRRSPFAFVCLSGAGHLQVKYVQMTPRPDASPLCWRQPLGSWPGCTGNRAYEIGRLQKFNVTTFLRGRTSPPSPNRELCARLRSAVNRRCHEPNYSDSSLNDVKRISRGWYVGIDPGIVILKR